MTAQPGSASSLRCVSAMRGALETGSARGVVAKNPVSVMLIVSGIVHVLMGAVLKRPPVRLKRTAMMAASAPVVPAPRSVSLVVALVPKNATSTRVVVKSQLNVLAMSIA